MKLQTFSWAIFPSCPNSALPIPNFLNASFTYRSSSYTHAQTALAPGFREETLTYNPGLPVHEEKLKK